VTMRAENGTTSWFVMTFSNILPGWDVVSQTYPGWCVQLSTEMSRGVDHSVGLYSSIDPRVLSGIPWPSSKTYNSSNWDKVNYVINHKQGASKSTIQAVIWW
jgi:hypothetical protein